MENSEQENLSWSFTEKFFFKFFFILFLLFLIFENNGSFPFFEYLMFYPTELLHEFMTSSYGITIFSNGSGDTTYDYIVLLGAFIAALFGTLIWSVLDKNKKSYPVLYYYLTVAVRFYVGLMLINYGFVKVFKLQFPYPGPYRMLQQYGNSSPMGLAWTFLGFSKGYNLFMGVAEILGVLLLFRRTMTAGLIIALMTTSNVMAVNYFYDVPVKILSTFLVMMCLFLLAKNIKILVQFFFMGQSVSLPVITPPDIQKKWLLYSIRGFKILLIVYVFGTALIEGPEQLKEYGGDAPKPLLYGAYEVETFVLGKDTIPPSLNDSTRWRQLIVDRPGFARVKYMNDSLKGFTFTAGEYNKEIKMSPQKNPEMNYSFNYTIPDKDHLFFSGKVYGDSAFVNFKKYDLSQTRLMGRGFHWINEFPFNR